MQLLSQINALIVRVRDRTELFRENMPDRGPKRVRFGCVDRRYRFANARRPRFSLGTAAKKDTSTRSSSRRAKGRLTANGPACRALRHLQPVICNDIATDSSVSEVREELLKRGHRSVGCFSAHGGGARQRLLSRCCGEANAF